MAVLAILQPDARSEARLSGALSGAHDVRTSPSWEALLSTLESGAVDGCLLDAVHPDRSDASDRVATLRARFPDLAIVACVEPDEAEGFFGLGGLGFDGVVFASSRPQRIRADVDIALSASRAHRVERSLASRVAAPGPAAIAWAMEQAGRDTSVDRLAAALGHSARSLREALADAGLPSPARVLLWGRLLVAGARLGDDQRRVEDVAFSLGYATATSFARAMKLHTGLTPAQVSRRGGMDTVLAALFPLGPGESHGDGGAEAAPDDGRSGGRTTGQRGPSGRSGSEGRSATGSEGKRARFSAVTTLALLVHLAGCATLGAGGGPDRGAIDRLIDTPPIDQLHVGVLAVDASSGRTLYAHNAHRKFVPASNQKVLVTATALSLLGPDHRFRTELRATGPVRDGVLEGDLFVVASGDPSLSDRYWASGSAALAAIADTLRARGIERIAGTTIVDVSAWDSTSVGPTWEVEDLRFGYGSTGGAFAVDEGEIEVIVTAGHTEGAAARVVWSPKGTDDFVQSRLVTAPADSGTRVRPNYLPESRRLILDGAIELGTTDTLSFAIRDPVRQASAALVRAMHAAGVSTNRWEVRWTRESPGHDCAPVPTPCMNGRLLGVLESPPLSDLVAGILEPSQNWMTEQLVRALGARYGATGSWSEGVGVVEAYLVNEVGVEPSDLAPRDGSGLSAYNLVTPRALVRILREMRAGPHAEVFRTALAEPGEEDSTLENRLPELGGRLFAKTGTISNVNSLSGYLVREDGREVVFSILTNASGLPASRVRRAIDEIVLHLAR